MRNPYSVSQINAYIKNMFRQDYMLQSILVRGEVSNCTYHSSGHIYFTLKDPGGAISCVMWAGTVRSGGLRFRMKEGDSVIVAGSVDVFEKSGRYQLYASAITADGIGILSERYEQLRRELEEEGVFDPRYKRPIPRYIRTLGVVTAPTGAAVQDICSIALRRNPFLRIILYPAVVQGSGAAESIVAGIRALSALPEAVRPETIIVGRGGGSIEDLWAFNERPVAQAVFDCEIPVISAVGHQTDTVITDWVADLRAATPSEAAEKAVFEYRRFQEELTAAADALLRGMNARTDRLRGELLGAERELRHLAPDVRIREQRMELLHLEEQLGLVMKRRVLETRRRAESFSGERFLLLMRQKLESARNRLALAAGALESGSPLRRLSGGYGFITGENAEPVSSVQALHAGERLHIRLRDGSADALVEQVRPEAMPEETLLNYSERF